MAQEVRGVIARSKGAPVEVTTIVVPDPGPGEAVVAVQACGVCHTDLHYREGGINDEYPFLLGHEAAGVVEAVGDGVTDLEPGDYVILNWRAVCGTCRACLRGRPWYCFSTFNASQPMTLTDGTALSPALGIGAFAEKTLVHSGQCTKVDPSASPAAVGLLGCGIMAGIGAAVNTGGVTRGDSVAVIGCGGVGNAAVAGAKLAGATKIIAIDLDDRKLDWAKGFGATHTINAGQGDVVEAVQALTGGFGADVVIEAVGRPETWKQAFYARDLAGTVVLVGVPTPDMRLEMPLIDFFSRGGSLKSSWYGDCLPSRDFPYLVDLYQQGRLDLDAFVTETIALDQVEDAFTKMHHGDVLRSVVLFDGTERAQ
jgi:S-(hydroxymethyl)mycothiol dehydrogenase